jgi:hypothetical protein
VGLLQFIILLMMIYLFNVCMENKEEWVLCASDT